MSYTKLRSYAVNAIADILPLDRDTCQEMVNYALTLPSDHETELHFLNLLGESEATRNFLSKFVELKTEDEVLERAKVARHKRDVKSQSPLNTTAKTSKATNAWLNSPPPKTKAPAKNRLEGNSSSKTTSELFDLKPSNQLSSNQAKKSKRRNLDNLKEIEAVLNELEVQKTQMNPTTSHASRVCNCMATRHPLFEVAPNCLNCGKIICAKEGLQPCLFCGNPLLLARDKSEIINILKAERESIEDKQENLRNRKVQELTPVNKQNKIVYSMKAGENLWDAQDRALKKVEAERRKIQEAAEKVAEEKKQIEEQRKELEHYQKTQSSNPDLLKAQERLETLLSFQSTGAERTRIIDNALDFDMPNMSSGNMWLSPVERALHLKKQQRLLKKYEDTHKERTGRGKKVVEMVIKDGKVTMVEKYVATTKKGEDDEIQEMEASLRDHKIAEDETLSQNIWDYERDKQRWEKPVYTSSKDEPLNGAPFLPKQRVQLAGGKDDMELLVAMP